MFAEGIIFQNSMSYYQYLKAKYFNCEESMNDIHVHSRYCLNLMDESSMDAEWLNVKSREAMTHIVKLRRNLHIPHKEMYYVSKDTYLGCGLNSHLHYMYKKNNYPGKICMERFDLLFSDSN